MTKEDKELLLKDLCARLPYGLKYNFGGNDGCDYTMDRISLIAVDDAFPIEDCKPYLFPLSSMTEEQYKEWCDLEAKPIDEILMKGKMSKLEHHLLIAKSITDSVNYCYKNHFDVYGLIEKGLAIDATGLNIY